MFRGGETVNSSPSGKRQARPLTSFPIQCLVPLRASRDCRRNKSLATGCLLFFCIVPVISIWEGASLSLTLKAGSSHSPWPDTVSINHCKHYTHSFSLKSLGAGHWIPGGGYGFFEKKKFVLHKVRKK